MNNQWNRKRSFNPWNDGNGNQNFANISHYSGDWSPKSWHSMETSFKMPRRNMNRRNSNRWEPMQRDREFSHLRESSMRNDFERNPNRNYDNYRKRFDFKHNSNDDQTQFKKLEENRYNMPYKRWCRDLLREDPAQTQRRMQIIYWDKLDPKEDIYNICSKPGTKNIKIPPYDGVTPIGKEEITKAWLCTFCKVVLLDSESKKLHLMAKNHYIRYANFCKNYTEEKLLKLNLEKKLKKERKERKHSKISFNDSLLKAASEKKLEEKSKDEEKKLKSTKDKKEKMKLNQHQGIDKKHKLPSKLDLFHAEDLDHIDVSISMDEELNYDCLE